MSIESQIVPDEYYSAKDIDRLFTALEKRFQEREVMRSKEAAKLLGLSVSQLYRIQACIPSHKVPGISGRLYLRSELIDHIKKY